VFQGLTPENKADKMTAMMYRFLGNQYTVYAVNRRPGLPPGYTLGDMADDYARVVREAFGGPVDAIGVSSGGRWPCISPRTIPSWSVDWSSTPLPTRSTTMRSGSSSSTPDWEAPGNGGPRVPFWSGWLPHVGTGPLAPRRIGRSRLPARRAHLLGGSAGVSAELDVTWTH